MNLRPELGLTFDDVLLVPKRSAIRSRSAVDTSTWLTPNIKLTIPDGFERMLEHIAVHRYYIGVEQQREVPWEEAAAHWYDTIYLPVVEIIRNQGFNHGFPGRSEADLYLWVIERRELLKLIGGD